MHESFSEVGEESMEVEKVERFLAVLFDLGRPNGLSDLIGAVLVGGVKRIGFIGKDRIGKVG